MFFLCFSYVFPMSFLWFLSELRNIQLHIYILIKTPEIIDPENPGIIEMTSFGLSHEQIQILLYQIEAE